jgi:hypothetical protein
MISYDKTQIGWKGIIILTIILAFLIFSYFFQWGTNPLPFPVLIFFLIVFFIVMLTFYKLRIRIDNQGIHVIFGIGLIHIRIQPDWIKKIDIVKNPWYHGRGIRIDFKGISYNLQGAQILEIRYYLGRAEKIVRISSNDCSNLKSALERRYPQSHIIP